MSSTKVKPSSTDASTVAAMDATKKREYGRSRVKSRAPRGPAI
jgi:hypothetical protein